MERKSLRQLRAEIHEVLLTDAVDKFERIRYKLMYVERDYGPGAADEAILDYNLQSYGLKLVSGDYR